MKIRTIILLLLLACILMGADDCGGTDKIRGQVIERHTNLDPGGYNSFTKQFEPARTTYYLTVLRVNSGEKEEIRVTKWVYENVPFNTNCLIQRETFACD